MPFGMKKQKNEEKTSKEERIKTKEERFKKVASRRVDEVLNKLRLLRNCAHTGNYLYTEEQIRKLLNTVDSEWRGVKSDFNKGVARTSKRRFSFD